MTQNDVLSQSDKPQEEEKKLSLEEELEQRFGNLNEMTDTEIRFEEFLAQVNFKRSVEIEGYSETKIDLTFVPYKQTSIE